MTEEKKIALIERMEANANRILLDCKMLREGVEIKQTPFEDMTPDEQYDFIIKGVAEFYATTPKELLKKVSIHSHIARKKYIIKLLYEKVGFSYQEIADRLDYKDHGNVLTHHRDISEQMEDHQFNDDRVKSRYEAILKYLNFES